MTSHPADNNTLISNASIQTKFLLFRLGDFYETFDEDAEITARELDIVLTSRPVGKGVRVPLAGIPYHALDNYLARLIEKGYHVAICEQMSDTPVNGLVPRKVVRVVTPGTITEPGLLPGELEQLPRLGHSGREICFCFICRYHHWRIRRHRTPA